MIIVELTPLEARAYEATKDVEEALIENALTLDAFAKAPALPFEAVLPRIAPLIEAAKSARRKIAEATRFEIRVVGGEA